MLVKVVLSERADAVDGGDDRDRDARCNQAVFNGGGTGFVLNETSK